MLHLEETKSKSKINSATQPHECQQQLILIPDGGNSDCVEKHKVAGGKTQGRRYISMQQISAQNIPRWIHYSDGCSSSELLNLSELAKEKKKIQSTQSHFSDL